MRSSRSLTTVILLLALSFSIFSCGDTNLPAGTYKNGAVMSIQSLASQVGVDILKQGGNAVDAAVAVSYALAVVSPQAGNIGGGGFMVIHTPDGFKTAIDYREKAPGKAFRDMYLDEQGNVVDSLYSRGALSAGVPGTVAGTLLALEKYGTMTREEVIAPAIKLAEEGWILDRTMGGDRFKIFASTNKIFNKPDGTAWQIGEKWIQKDLAETLKRIATDGRDGFYNGITADMVEQTMYEYKGIISKEDLANYQPVEREPVTGTYRGYDIISMSPPSSGGTCMIQILNVLEPYNLTSMGYKSTESVHLIAEAMRRTYADRAEFLGDPDFVDIPVKKLTNKEYAKTRGADIDLTKATPSSEISHGDPSVIPYESDETTHYSVIDKDGMIVAVTTTLENSFGSHLVVEGAGFLLNDEMGDFSAKPGVPNTYGLLGGDANAIEPNKRMLSSMTPTIVTKDGKGYMVAGAAGGSRIITMVTQSIINVIDFGLPAEEAFGVPSFHHQWYPEYIRANEGALNAETVAELEAMGHTVKENRFRTAHGIIIDPVTGLLHSAQKTGAGY